MCETLWALSMTRINLKHLPICLPAKLCIKYSERFGISPLRGDSRGGKARQAKPLSHWTLTTPLRQASCDPTLKVGKLR